MSKERESLCQFGPETPLRDLHAEHDRLWALFCATPLEERREWSAKGYSGETEACLLWQQMKRLVEAIGDRERDFESDLRTALGAKMQDVSLAGEVYAALCNVDWEHEDGSRYGSSWRSAGGLVAEIRDGGEDYLDWYCNGNEGHVSERVAEALAALGWKATPCE